MSELEDMFQPEKFIEEIIADAKERISGKAIIACSGGVDSTTLAKLMCEAIGDRAFPTYVDNGYMRRGETEEVTKRLSEAGIPLTVINASERFYEKLRGVTDPKDKRNTIGEEFIRIFEERALEIGADYLVQGTIAPDWIESGGGLRDTIKPHHNVGALPKDLKLKLYEPFRDLYKDEVRKIARALNVPVSERQPFPGPGLAIRILGEATKEKAEIVREASYIVETEIDKAVENGEMERPAQYFAILTNSKAVGVHGDIGIYKSVIAIRSVDTGGFMSAKYTRIPYDILERISIRIANELKEHVSRVVYDVTHKPPATICWE